MWTLLFIIFFLGVLMATYWIVIPIILLIIGICCDSTETGVFLGIVSFIILGIVYKLNKED